MAPSQAMFLRMATFFSMLRNGAEVPADGAGGHDGVKESGTLASSASGVMQTPQTWIVNALREIPHSATRS